MWDVSPRTHDALVPDAKPTYGAVRMERFLDEVLALTGVPYLWGGKSEKGIDCSGVVTFALWQAGGPDWRQTHNTDTLLAELDVAHELLPLDLVLYGQVDKTGKLDANHVMIHLASGLVVGACGGNRNTTTLAIARERNAKVKRQVRYDYRTDVIGIRRIPFLIPRGDLSHGLIRS